MALTPEEQAELTRLKAERAQLQQQEEPSLIDKVDRGAAAISEGIKQGGTNVLQDLELGSRQLLGKSGLRPEGDVEQTKAAQQAQRIRARETGARAEYPTAGSIGELFSDTALRLGGGAAVASPIGAAGLAGAVAKAGVAGGVVGGSQTPQGDESRAGNTIQTAAMFAAFPAIGAAGSAIAGKIKPVASAAAMKAFDKLGVSPTLSQIVKSPAARDAAQSVEKFLEQIPLVGTKMARRAQFRNTEKIVTQIGKEAEKVTRTGGAISKEFQNVFRNTKTGAIDLSKTNKAAEIGLNSLESSAKLSKLSPKVKEALSGLQTLKPRNLDEAHSFRRTLDDVIRATARTRSSTNVLDQELKVMRRVRRIYEKNIEGIAKKNGVLSQYQKAKVGYQKVKDAELIEDAFAKSLEKSGIVDLNAFRKQITKTSKLFSPQLGNNKREILKSLDHVIGKLNQLPKPTAGPSGIGTIGTIAATAGAQSMGDVDAGTIGSVGAVIKGISLLLTTRTGVKLVTKGASGGDSEIASILSTAAKFGVAASQKDSMPDINNMSLEELKALKAEINKGQ